MNQLANFLVENILNEEVNPITALFGGGFKPPTAGHLEVVKRAINNNPEIDKVIIYVGGKVRNGVTQDQAIEIWNKFYKPQINKPVEILPSVAPVKDIYRYAKNNPEETVYWVIGAREGREDDLKDIANRSISIDKYPNLQLKTTSTPDGGMSGTNARKAIVNNNFEEFERYLPDNVDKNAIWDILTKQELNEIDLKKYVDKIKKGFNKFIEALKQEKQETKDAFNLLVQAVKEKKELSPEEKKEIGNQLKDVFKTIGYVGLFALPGGSLFTILFNLLKLNKYVLPSAFLDKQELNEADPKKGTGKKPKGSGRRLYTDEDPSDTVKVKFSSRQDIVDTLNKKSFKSKSHARQSQIINLIHQRVRAALGRTKDPQKKAKLRSAFEYIKNKKEASKKKTQRLKKQKNENVAPNHDGKAAPFGSGYKKYKKVDETGLKVAKKNMDDYKKSNQLNENATYSNHIDYKQEIIDLTKHMLKKGMNIRPLPKIVFKHGDEENAQDFLGRTAYYDPNKMMVVLYTEGRHPKDIARSYAHEMIHHIQNLEGRLENISTTNTMKDDHLNDIEREAYTKGNMLFRNYTDGKDGEEVTSLNEKEKPYKHKYGFNDKLGKDPFGLNQFAREIAIEVEDAMNKEKISYKIFSDMDGVLTDFDKSFLKYSEGIPPREYEKTYGKEKFWELIDGKGGVGFWVGMPWMEDGKQYWDYIKNYDTELLSSPSRSSTSRLGKRLWVRNNMPGIKLTLAQAAKKQNYAAPNHILIDDRPSNIDQWRSQGGIGILHTSAADTISQLKKLGL